LLLIKETQIKTVKSHIRVANEKKPISINPNNVSPYNKVENYRVNTNNNFNKTLNNNKYLKVVSSKTIGKNSSLFQTNNNLNQSDVFISSLTNNSSNPRLSHYKLEPKCAKKNSGNQTTELFNDSSLKNIKAKESVIFDENSSFYADKLFKLRKNIGIFNQIMKFLRLKDQSVFRNIHKATRILFFELKNE